MEIFEQLQSWHWFVLAAVLFGVEIFLSTGFFIGIALAALVVAILLLLIPAFSWAWQLLLFGLLSLVISIGYKVLFKKFNDATDNPLLNNRAAQMIGKSIVLGADLELTGAEMIGDTRWKLRCNGNIVSGTKVKIVAVEGMVLVVEPL